MSLTSGIELAPLKVALKADITGFESTMEQAKITGVAAAEKISGDLEKVATAGKKLSSVGDTMTKYVSAPLAAAGVATIKMASDFETSFAKVSTLLDSGTVNYDQYKKAILENSSKMKVGVDDYAEAVYQSISASVDQKDAIEFTNKAVILAKGGFTSTASAVDIMTTAINGYGLSAQDATKISDDLITTQNLGKTTVDQLASSMGKVIPVASSVNFSIDELSSSYALLTKNGIDTAEAGTYLRQMLSELGKAGSDTDSALRELTGKGFAELKAEGVPTSEVLQMLSQYASANGKTLKDMFGSVEAGSAAMVLARNDGKDYNDILKQMESNAGAAQSAFEKMDATPAEQMQGALNKLHNAGVKVGEDLIPMFVKFADAVDTLATDFDNMDESQREVAVTMGVVLAAAGPVLKVAGTAMELSGNVADGIKKVIDKMTELAGKAPAAEAAGESAGKAAEAAAEGLEKVTEAAPEAANATEALAEAAEGAASATGGMAAAAPEAAGAAGELAGEAVTATAAVGEGGLATASEAAAAGIGGIAAPLALVVGGVIAFTAAAQSLGGYLASNDLTDKAQVFNDYSENLKSLGDNAQYASGTAGMASSKMVEFSDSTKAAVGAYMELDQGAQTSLLNLQYNSTTITGQIATDMTTQFSNMAQSVTTTLDTNYNQDLADLQVYFDSNKAITSNEQAQMLANLQANYEGQKTTVNDALTQITTILQTASDQNRTLTADEVSQISTLRQQMRDTAVTNMSETESECTVILNRLKDSNAQITAETASTAIQNANKARDGEVQAANEKCEKTIDAAKRLREAGVITEDQYNQMVASAEQSKNDSIQKANEAADGVRDTIARKSPEAVGQVDLETGQIYSRWDRTVAGITGIWNAITLPTKTGEVYTDSNGITGRWNSIQSYWDLLWFPTKFAEIITQHTDVYNAVGGGGGGGGGGSWYNGINYIPYDGYVGVMHKGERVLTADENKAYVQGMAAAGGGNGDILISGNNFTVRNDKDIELIAQELWNLKNKESRGGGLG